MENPLVPSTHCLGGKKKKQNKPTTLLLTEFPHVCELVRHDGFQKNMAWNTVTEVADASTPHVAQGHAA